MSEAPITDVSGGYGGVEARYEDMEQLAGLLDGAGDGLRQDAWDDKGIAANGDLLESSILSPGSFASAESSVLGATIGPHGLAFRAVGFEVDALAVRANVDILRGSDELVHQAFEALDYLGGRAIGAVLPGALLVGAVGGAALLLSNPALTAYLVTHRDELGDAAVQDLQQWVEDHPDLVQHLVNGGGGLIDGLGSNLPPGVREAVLAELGIDPFHGTTNDAAGDIADLLTDSGADVAPSAGDGRDLPTAGSLEELIGNLSATNDGADGEIDIQQIGEGPDARYVVNLPGTDSWGDDPGDARDLQANLQLVGGQSTAYQAGIEEAMRQAGIPDGAPVMLVGHSQGGMTAMNLAADPGFSSRYDVQHVVTAGSPTAQVPDVPDGTQVISLENSGDVVPLTDGEDNPDQPNRTTVQFDGRTGSIGDNHSLGVYGQGAAAVDDSADPSLTHSLQQLRDDGFLGSDAPSTTRGYTITRDRG